MDYQAKPTPEHEWLHQMLGDWTYESECDMGPDQPLGNFSGSDSVRSLGGLWILCEGHGIMPDGDEGRMIITLGYDSAKKRFVGTFVGSMMANLWVYDGELDADRKVLTLTAEGPSFSGDGTLTLFHDIMKIHDADHRTLSSEVRNPDGTWTKFMTAKYTRTK